MSCVDPPPYALAEEDKPPASAAIPATTASANSTFFIQLSPLLYFASGTAGPLSHLDKYTEERPSKRGKG